MYVQSLHVCVQLSLHHATSVEIWLSFTNKKRQCARNLFQIHHMEQTPVVLVPKVVMRIVGKMPTTTTCCKPLNSDFPITFVRLHFPFQPWGPISMYWDTNCLTKIDGNVGHFPRFYDIWHQTCLLTSGALDHNSILMHSGQRCSMERSQNSKKVLLNRVVGMEVALSKSCTERVQSYGLCLTSSNYMSLYKPWRLTKVWTS